MLIVADDKIPFLKGILEPFAEVKYLSGAKISPDDVKNADAIITRTRTICNRQLLEGSKVRFIATATIGYDHIDTDYCAQNGIAWTNAEGCNSRSVMQYVVSAILNNALKRQIYLKDKVLGIAGVGNVGSKVEKAAKALGMKVLLCDPPRAEKEGETAFTSMNRILAEADYISLHVPLTQNGNLKTFHMADKTFFGQMKPDAFLINSSRGEVVETEALKNALKNRQIAGACLDVWENEPDIDLDLVKHIDIATPHIAGYSTDGKANGTAMSVNAIAKFFGLSMEKWYPDFVPPPEHPLIKLSGSSFEEQAASAVFQSYNLMRDDQRLRLNPSDFEKQRGDYPIRREFDSYTVIANGHHYDPAVLDALKLLGFKIN